MVRNTRRLLKKSGPERFDAVFSGPDDELVMDLVGRIEGPKWKPTHVMSLSPPEAHLVRMCRFDGIFGNGGLQYWFECDSEMYGRHTSVAFRVARLDDAALALDDAYSIFPTQRHYDDFDMRMRAVREFAGRFKTLESRLWRWHSEIPPRAAAFARDNKAAFEHLRRVRPWCSIMEEFGDA
jgi:hypothetical protein